MGPLVDKFHAFGWDVVEVDGHDHEGSEAALAETTKEGMPKVVIAHTIKGKGVSFMENSVLWHYRNPQGEEFENAIKELALAERAAMRDAFVEQLTALAENDPDVMFVTGDLGFGVFDDFAKRFPKQYLNVGVAEQNMTGVAAGLALEGKKYLLIPVQILLLCVV